ncbi:adenosylmethionine decarboxylase [Photorhabdus bodei]|uniref:S-adenosylmethionine decarboxylase proenzyme n=1 Tax=Photorhabdus bodei TaxID=2029681 RepID=A0AAW6BHP9_9GAMM|nr:adenosylmethionine decarboxylase [Photorhabdus bodei]MCC8463671.1 adenosylmethionine decarboxylase [Photorhabdus bodei]MDB6372235.1 adenosylmethionine decarboxylase [Photorhabdus bodei]
MLRSSSVGFAEYSFLGTHVFAEFYGVDKYLLNNENELITIMRQAVEASGATILNVISHKFDPEGMTALLLLSESHASIHTYPDRSAAFIDIFTCGNCDPETSVSELKKLMNPDGLTYRCIVRGNNEYA